MTTQPTTPKKRDRSTGNPMGRPRSHSTNLLGAFCDKFKISSGDLAEMAGCSKSSAYRLMCDDLSPKLRSSYRIVLGQRLPIYLMKRGVDAAEIDRELKLLFNEGEYQPMIAQRIELDPDECKYFGFTDRDGRPCDPFSRKPLNLEEVFITPPFQKIIDRVEDAIRYQGFVCVTGDIGSGKSTLRDLMEHQVSEKSDLVLVWPEFYDMRNISPMQIAEAIIMKLGVQGEPIPFSAVKRFQAVMDKLVAAFRSGKRVAIAFDECHKLNDKTISSLKNFLEMSSGGFQRYLGVIMFGQRSIESRLESPIFQEIYERIVVINMPGDKDRDDDKKKIPAFKDYAREYLAHRLQYVGKKLEDVFDDDALRLVCNQGTTPLNIGNIANAALRISRTKFDNKKVIGKALEDENLFTSQRQPGFKQRS
jgi:type II secretory pathway predicted ATPase ExeA